MTGCVAATNQIRYTEMQVSTLLPTLFKLTSTGKGQQWTIKVEYIDEGASAIVTTYGQVGGKLQTTRDVIREGKNVGKANETTPEEQALAEAQAQHSAKLKKGYVLTLDGAKAGERDAVITGGLDPMLAHRFDEQGHKINFPCYIQPKFDGHRCIAVLDSEGKATLWSRTRKPITGVPHIQRELEALGLSNIAFDGELYNHAYKDKFDELTSFIRQVAPKPGHEVVEYHVYDIAQRVRGNDDFHQRNRSLQHLLQSANESIGLVLVETRTADTEEEALAHFQDFLAQGYEGAMARNLEGKYENKRSYNLQKIKEFQDSEFRVVGVEEGRGKLAGHAIFVCEMPKSHPPGTGVTFNVKMKGETAQLKQYFDNPALAIGRMLTVKYFGITAKNGVPRFPIGIRFAQPL